MNDTLIDDLEIDYGTAILEALTGQRLTRRGQPTRLFDQTKHSAENFNVDQRGKPFIKNHQTGECWYPISAYREVHQVDFKTALTDLCRQYGLEQPPVEWQARTAMSRPVRQPLPVSHPIDHLPVEAYERCRTRFHRNGLYEYLRFTFGQSPADGVFVRYRLGTSRRWQYYGYLATCLPQFDIAGRLRQVKIMSFDVMNGRRVKKHQQAHQWNNRNGSYEPTAPDSDKTFFAGKQLARQAGVDEANLQQCFFGEHLLPEYPGLTVAIVEAESTALVCSILYPDYLWLATGGSNGARWTDPETFGVLHGRDVVLWPDQDAHEVWVEKARLLQPLVRSLKVTDYVKRNAPAGMTKADLRDLATRPCYVPADSRSVIFGESLPP